MATNHGLAVRGRNALCAALGIGSAAPDEMIGSMAALLLPEPRGTALGPSAAPGRSPLDEDPLQLLLLERHGIEVPVLAWPPPAWAEPGGYVPRRLIRISAQLYNRAEQYERLGAALAELLGAA